MSQIFYDYECWEKEKDADIGNVSNFLEESGIS